MWNFIRISKVNNSLLIRSDALHYSSDLFMNGGILIALLASKYLGFWWADSLFAIGIGLWIMKNAFPIIWSGITMLLDRSMEESEIREIEDVLRNEDSLEGFHYLKTRRSGDDIFIEAHIVFIDKDISLKQAHTISEDVESVLGARFPGVSITLHLDIDPEPEVCSIKKE